MSDYDFEEEEFNTQFNGGTLRRIGAQLRPHWRGVAGFLAAVAFVSFFDAYLTFVQKRIVDEGILAHNPAALLSEENRQSRIDSWRTNTHPAAKSFPGDPRRIEEQRPAPAELTSLGRRLLGIDRWD